MKTLLLQKPSLFSCQEFGKYVIGEETVAKLSNVSLSKDTIVEMSVDIFNQVVMRAKASKFRFAIQLDESTDAAECSQLPVYACLTNDNAPKNELLLSQELSTQQKDIFDVLDNFLNRMVWGKLFGCTTDGAPSELGRTSGFQSYAKDASSNVH